MFRRSSRLIACRPTIAPAPQVAGRGTHPTLGAYVDVVAPPTDHGNGRYSGIMLQGAQMLFLLGEAPKKPWSEGLWMYLSTPW